MTFGEKLKNARKESGLSQEQLAEKIVVYARLVEVHYGTDVCINPPSGDGQPH